MMVYEGLTLNIWFTCPSGMWFGKLMCPVKILTSPANMCASPVKLMYTTGKISTCSDLKITSQLEMNHKSLCALGQDIHAPGMRARLNVKPCVPLTVPWATNFHWILIKIHLFTCNKNAIKMVSANRRQFCVALNVIRLMWVMYWGKMTSWQASGLPLQG